MLLFENKEETMRTRGKKKYSFSGWTMVIGASALVLIFSYIPMVQAFFLSARNPLALVPDMLHFERNEDGYHAVLFNENCRITAFASYLPRK